MIHCHCGTSHELSTCPTCHGVSILCTFTIPPQPVVFGYQETEADKIWCKERQREADLQGLRLDMIELDRMNRGLTGDY